MTKHKLERSPKRLNGHAWRALLERAGIAFEEIDLSSDLE
jgi:hypothetical protein